MKNLTLNLSKYCCSDENMMDPYNLAICFGPTLVPIPEERDQVQFQNLVNELIKNFIIFHEDIFPLSVPGKIMNLILIKFWFYCFDLILRYSDTCSLFYKLFYSLSTFMKCWNIFYVAPDLAIFIYIFSIY